jgi:diguanylate cyclase (GGDEF)-like protein
MNIPTSLPTAVSPRPDSRPIKSSATEPVPLEFATATPRESWVAVAVVLISVLVLAAVVPFARVPLSKITAFIPSYESALALSDLITAVLLFGKTDPRSSRELVTLACGYLFNAIMTVFHALSFPGVFSATGLLGGDDQTTAWIFIFWHGGFPLFVLGYALLAGSDNVSNDVNRYNGRTIAFSILGVVAIAAALTFLATVGHNLLPKIIEAGDYSLMISTGASPTVLVLSILALLATWARRERKVLDVWVMVIMSAWALDVTLSAIVSASRYDLGWYAGRIYGLVAACCLLIVLLIGTNRLHARLMNALAIARSLEQHLKFRAETDFLTGLPNRALFYDRLETAMTRCRRSKNLMALLYLDIDDFKGINDNLGHAAGDEVLRYFAQRLLQCLRASDTVARLGGDEFTVILENISSREIAMSVVNKLMAALRRPYEIGEEEIQSRASIGIAYFTGAELKADDLIKQADAALYKAKQHGRDHYSVHAPETASVL